MTTKNNFTFNNAFIQQQKMSALTLLFSLVIVDTIFVEGSSDLIIFGLLGIYIVGIYLYKLKSKTSLLFSLVLLVITYISFLLSGPSLRTEKAAVWVFFFLLIGITQQFKE
ncbi:hypothetical protein C4559_02130 [Candidatus Microgenomates bacterium]|nr:MAG: hypothetical protein C4559_02130 [Candidatus Microgenomates bacterium]